MRKDKKQHLTEAEEAAEQMRKKRRAIAAANEIAPEESAIDPKVFDENIAAYFSQSYTASDEQQELPPEYKDYFETDAYIPELKILRTKTGVELEFSHIEMNEEDDPKPALLCITATKNETADDVLDSIARAFASAFLANGASKETLDIEIDEIGEDWDRGEVLEAFKRAGFKRIFFKTDDAKTKTKEQYNYWKENDAITAAPSTPPPEPEPEESEEPEPEPVPITQQVKKKITEIKEEPRPALEVAAVATGFSLLAWSGALDLLPDPNQSLITQMAYPYYINSLKSYAQKLPMGEPATQFAQFALSKGLLAYRMMGNWNWPFFLMSVVGTDQLKQQTYQGLHYMLPEQGSRALVEMTGTVKQGWRDLSQQGKVFTSLAVTGTILLTQWYSGAGMILPAILLNQAMAPTMNRRVMSAVMQMQGTEHPPEPMQSLVPSPEAILDYSGNLVGLHLASKVLSYAAPLLWEAASGVVDVTADAVGTSSTLYMAGTAVTLLGFGYCAYQWAWQRQSARDAGQDNQREGPFVEEPSDESDIEQENEDSMPNPDAGNHQGPMPTTVEWSDDETETDCTPVIEKPMPAWMNRSNLPKPENPKGIYFSQSGRFAAPTTPVKSPGFASLFDGSTFSRDSSRRVTAEGVVPNFNMSSIDE